MLNSYLQNVMIFIILTVVIEIILPSEQYSKYIRLVIGFVLMLNIIIPIQRIIAYTDRESVTISYDNIENKLMKDSDNSDIEKQYKSYIENNLNTQLELLVSSSTEYVLTDCDIDIETMKNDYVINNIVMQLKRGEENNINNDVYIRPIEKIQLNVNKTSDEVNENVQDIVENTEIKDLKNNISVAYNVDISNIHINILQDEEGNS